MMGLAGVAESNFKEIVSLGSKSKSSTTSISIGAETLPAGIVMLYVGPEPLTAGPKT